MATGLGISIAHCSEQRFLESFRRDLCDAQQRVAILSPFLSSNRAVDYYPVLRTVTARQVVVDVYAKPKNEQPDSLRDHFDVVQRGLKTAGVCFHVRPGMHEKVGVIDRRVLWHGSLNILSHNDTRESMLRIESGEVALEVLADLGIGDSAASPPKLDDGGAEGTPPSALAESPPCPQCAGSMRLYEKTGMWICASSPRCSGVLPMSANRVQADVTPQARQLSLACPLCSRPMEISRGIVLRVACPDAACGFALEPRLAAWILRVLRRRGEG
jgi:hypothetical protein